ncbi:MAG: apolipoprotein N-acyltransferase [Methyloligellaceae bacterium]
MRTLVRWIAEATSWRRSVLAFTAGSASVLAMAPIFVWPVLFATLPVFVWLLDGIVDPNLKTKKTSKNSGWRRAVMIRQAAITGWIFGFGYFLFGLFWIGEAFLVEAEKFAWLLPFAVSMMPAGLALFYGLAAALAAFFWRRGASRVVVLALAFLAAEWLRGNILTGFPWNSLGYGLTANDPLMQSASIFGVDGLVFCAVLIFASPAVLLDGKSASDAPIHWRFPAVMLVLLLAAAGGGAVRLHMSDTSSVDNVRLRIVQPNIPQIEKWKPDNQLWIFQRHLDLSRQNGGLGSQGPQAITHLIWPEVASPFLLARSEGALSALADMLPEHVTFLTGAIRAEDSGRTAAGKQKRDFFNSIYVMDHDAKILSTYDKMHLVPFGEYLPFQSVLEAVGLEQLTKLRGGFRAGLGPRHLRAPGVPAFGPLICYEIIFSGAVVNANDRPAWFLNVTNDGWFGRSAGPYQHFHQARVRAVEEGLPVVRAANTGVSAIVGPYGRVIKKLGLNSQGVIDGALPTALRWTVFSKYRTSVLFLFVVTAVGMILAFTRDTGRLSQHHYMGAKICQIVRRVFKKQVNLKFFRSL